MAVAEIVSCHWLKDQLDTGVNSLTVLDVSWYSNKDAQENYLREHIPSAVYFNIMEGAIQTPVYQRNLPTPEVFQKNVRSVGVNSDSHVILYSDTDKLGFFSSGRAWWMFKYFGHDKVSVLNGGWKKWCQEGYPKTSDIPEVKEGNFTAEVHSVHKKLYEEVKVLSGTPAPQVIDTRPTSGYNKGHIPGTTNIPADLLMDVDRGELKSKEDLTELFRSSGIELEKSTVTHCNSGMSSCTMALALSIAGCKHWSVYHGGYKEWEHKTSPKDDKE